MHGATTKKKEEKKKKRQKSVQFIYLLPHVSADNYAHHQVDSQLHKSKYIEVETSTYRQRFPLCSSFRTTFVKQRFFPPSCFPPI